MTFQRIVTFPDWISRARHPSSLDLRDDNICRVRVNTGQGFGKLVFAMDGPMMKQQKVPEEWSG